MIIDNLEPKIVRRSLGLMLKEERLARGLDLEQAADGAKVPYHYMRRLEKGKGYFIIFFKRLLTFYGKQINIELVDRR